jgi:hypothetical protein
MKAALTEGAHLSGLSKELWLSAMTKCRIGLPYDSRCL